MFRSHRTTLTVRKLKRPPVQKFECQNRGQICSRLGRKFDIGMVEQPNHPNFSTAKPCVTLGAILDLLKQRSVRIQTGSALLRCERNEWFCVTRCPLKFFSQLKIRPVPCERPLAASLNDDTYS